MRPPLELEYAGRWRVNVRGPGSWELCRKAARRKPAWSHATRSWVVSEQTANEVLAMAEAAGMNIVLTGPRIAELRAQETARTEVATSTEVSPEPEPEGLW